MSLSMGRAGRPPIADGREGRCAVAPHQAPGAQNIILILSYGLQLRPGISPSEWCSSRIRIWSSGSQKRRSGQCACVPRTSGWRPTGVVGRGAVYQIYPRSFADSDGDGVGDLRGITERFFYLACLGVDAVWLSPIYPLPMVDSGYDVTDHTADAAMFGTLADFDALITEAHRLGLRGLLDYIPTTPRSNVLVSTGARVASERAAGLVPVARAGARRRPPEQPAQRVRRIAMDAGPSERAGLLPRLPARAARSEPAPSAGA